MRRRGLRLSKPRRRPDREHETLVRHVQELVTRSCIVEQLSLELEQNEVEGGEQIGVGKCRKSLIEGAQRQLWSAHLVWSLRPGALLLPLAELSVALGLLPVSTARLGALGALALLAVFVAAISFNLVRGRSPECNCFGALRSEPIGKRTLVRNGVLAAVAGFVVASGPGGSTVGWLGDLDAAEAGVVVVAGLLAVAVALGTASVIHLLRQNGRLLLRLDEIESFESAGLIPDTPEEFPEGLAIGSEAPAFSLPDPAGSNVSLETLHAGGASVLLVFTDPGCGPCDGLMPEVARWQREHDSIAVVAVSAGDTAAARQKAATHGLENVLFDEGGAVARSFEAFGTPTAVLVDGAGRVASGIASGAGHVEALLGVALREREESGLPPGTPAPELTLAGLDGSKRVLARLIHSQTVLLFWSPDCGFCRDMHPDLLAWEADRPPWAPRLVVISSGDVDATRAEGFESPVLVDEHSEAFDAFGAGGTPMALLVDADATIASTLVAGADSVLELLGAGGAVDGQSGRDRIRSR